MNFRLIIVILTLAICTTSCTPIFQMFYGIKTPKQLNDQKIIQHSEKFNIPLTDNYKLDSSYVMFLSSLDTAKFKEEIKNHYQPLQALYYNGNGQLESFQINCYAGGFPNLHWDRDSILTTFPPKEQAPIDNIIPLELLLKRLQPLPQTNSFLIKNYEYVIIVFWSRFMGRQSKRLIEVVQENCKLAKDYNVKIIYVNTDNLFDFTDNENQ